MGLSYSTDERSTSLLEVVGREHGFRVHRVEQNSPGQEAGLQSIVDYIVVANGVRLEYDDGTFVKMIAESKGKPMHLTIFDTHTLRTRDTVLTPRDDWGGSGLLGITIRFDLAQELSKHTLHVLDVFPDSPASAAGLDAYNDYIIGVGDLLFDGPDEFGEIVMHNERHPVRLYVYSVRTETVREVTITPNRDWGGEGCLGCGVGAGYLHAMPPRRDLRDQTQARALPPAPLAAATAAAETTESSAVAASPAASLPPPPPPPPPPVEAPASSGTQPPATEVSEVSAPAAIAPAVAPIVAPAVAPAVADDCTTPLPNELP